MELIDNVNKTLKDDLAVSIQKESKVSIAAACFSIYAFQELKRELKNVDELRFIFTSPTFIKEKAKKEKREFYIPRQTRERSLYGSEFEIKLRNEMTQRAIAKEDLLFQVMLDLGVLLSSKIEEKMISGKKVFNVADGFLIACFDSDITEETVKAVAQEKPYYAVFRDSSMASDSVATNFEQIFATYSPETVRKVL